MLFTKKKYQIHNEIEDFKLLRRHFISTVRYLEWIEKFVKITGVKSMSDIMESDMQAFIDAVFDSTSSHYLRLEATTALRIFMRSQKNAILESSDMSNKKIGRPRNESLRKEIIDKKKKGWSIRKIGEYYNRAPSTIHQFLTT